MILLFLYSINFSFFHQKNFIYQIYNFSQFFTLPRLNTILVKLHNIVSYLPYFIKLF